jgi:ribonuclease-3
MFAEFSKNINYTFNNTALLKEALTHPSANEEKNYERLEFLGDSVLTLAVTDILISKFKNEQEGDLAKRRAAVINGKLLSKIAESLDVQHYIILSDSEESMGGRDNSKILENSMEAIIGAMYLDGGIEAPTEFIKKHWIPVIEENISPPVDEKTFLQEWAQSHHYNIPVYTVSEKAGPDHNPNFTVTVCVSNLPKATGYGHSKKESEKNAAANMIKYIKQNDKKN